MKKYMLSLVCLLLFLSTAVIAQNRKLKQVLELQMPKTAEDDYCGTRGASVCWNPDTKKYYAGFAGNSMFPMGVFNAAGKRLSPDTLTTMQDIRGIWYDPATKLLMANCYNETGWISYSLDNTDIPNNFSIRFTT